MPGLTEITERDPVRRDERAGNYRVKHDIRGSAPAMITGAVTTVAARQVVQLTSSTKP
jgi:hypothetical protein